MKTSVKKEKRKYPYYRKKNQPQPLKTQKKAILEKRYNEK